MVSYLSFIKLLVIQDTTIKIVEKLKQGKKTQ